MLRLVVYLVFKMLKALCSPTVNLLLHSSKLLVRAAGNDGSSRKAGFSSEPRGSLEVMVRRRAAEITRSRQWSLWLHVQETIYIAIHSLSVHPGLELPLDDFRRCDDAYNGSPT